MLTDLTADGVPPTNNAAERNLRPLVIARKISGGTRSEQGSPNQDGARVAVRHVARTGGNPFTACQDLLATF